MFSAETKEELAHFAARSRCCLLAEFSAIARMTGRVAGRDLLGGGAVFEMATENAALARRMVGLMRELFDLRPSVKASRRKGRSPGHLYVVSLPYDVKTRAALREMGVILERSRGRAREAMRPGVPWSLLSKQCCRRAYLRGAFLARGYVQDPEKAYHMEMMADAEQLASGLARIASSFGVAARVSRHRGAFMVYVKGGDDVAQLLRVTGAHSSVIALESVRVMRGVRGDVNRVVNCDTANVGKAVDAGLAQAEAIKTFLERSGMARLPAGLREIAMLRLEHPEASLKELGEMAAPPITKSAANHRMRRLLNLARRAAAEPGDRGDLGVGANTLVARGAGGERDSEDGL